MRAGNRYPRLPRPVRAVPSDKRVFLGEFYPPGNKYSYMNKDAKQHARSLRDVKEGLKFFSYFSGTGIWGLGSGPRYESSVEEP